MDLLDFGYWDLETQTKHFMIASLMFVIKEYLGSVKLLHCLIGYLQRVFIRSKKIRVCVGLL